MGTREVSRERLYELSRMDENSTVTENDIRDAICVALQDMREVSYYGPLIDRYPVMFEEEMPAMPREHLIKDDTMACTDGNNVYVSASIIARHYKVWQSKATKEASHKGTYPNFNIISNMAALLAHEYTHILCQHTRIGREYENKTRLEQTCHTLACEIEANRGHLVKHDDTDAVGHAKYEVHNGTNVTWLCGVTDGDFPETKNDKYYPQIYATLLRTAKNNLEKMKEAMKMISDLATSMKMDGGDGQSAGNNKGEKGNENENNNKAQDKSQTSKNKSNDMGTTVATSSVNRQQNEDGESGEDWELTQEQIEASIKNAMQIQQTVAQEQKPGSESGYGLESPYIEYKPELTQQEMLEQDYARWHQAEVKNELKKMKGLIRGTISKNRESTYARPTRRPIQGGSLIKKGVRYEKSYSPKVLIAMDSSGSMSSTTMKEVACAIENIFKDLGKPKTGSYICKHESNVSDVRPMRDWKAVVQSYYPSGGNCFAHVVEEANKLGVDVVLNIGDGQDTITRSGYSEGAVSKFNGANRKWFDVLVTDKHDNSSYRQEAEYDENNGFHREGIYLGDKITQYLK